jgi:hypothetical protein
MALLNTYPIAQPNIDDTVIGTSYNITKEPKTVSFNIGSIVELAAATLDGWSGTLSVLGQVNSVPGTYSIVVANGLISNVTLVG